MIPAKFESQRLKRKNLALINGKPLIYYAIRSAKESGLFDRIVINSDHDIFRDISQRYKVEFYKRPAQLGSAITKADEVVKDFLEKNPCEYLTWVNPTTPLQTAEEIQKVVHYFLDKRLDSLITTKYGRLSQEKP